MASVMTESEFFHPHYIISEESDTIKSIKIFLSENIKKSVDVSVNSRTEIKATLNT